MLPTKPSVSLNAAWAKRSVSAAAFAMAGWTVCFETAQDCLALEGGLKGRAKPFTGVLASSS
jgi:hypothetical protein